MQKKYEVKLSLEERESLSHLVSKGTGTTRQQRRARVLLKADCNKGGPNWKNQKIVEAFDISEQTVTRIRRRYVKDGAGAAIKRKKHSRTRPRKITGEEEAKIIALACSQAPEGRLDWTISLLTKAAIELKIVPSISRETIRKTLKKTNLSPG